ncbi:MAG TPA: hypothetical protein ENK88_02795 [Campylobacterales bacterium]|nr:hypothetical protein [Campylobacterales bacterium]HHH51042.1 hypothetical protein [Campylobacterales bacterium]
MKKSLLILLLGHLYAGDITYNKNKIHAFLPKTKEVQFDLYLEKINDTIDVFNIKKSELGSNSDTSLGDMDGFGIDIGYTFNDKIYLNFGYNQKDLKYSDTTLTNKNMDLYLRYQLYRDKNSAFAIDGGYSKNSADDIYIYNLSTINNRLKKMIGDNRDITIKENSSDKYSVVYTASDGSKKTINLDNKPFVAIKDTSDSSLYTRAIYSYKNSNWLYDTYLGYSEISVSNTIDSSILHENNADLQDRLKNVNLKRDRTDDMLVAGLGIAYQTKDWGVEGGYQYNNLFRVKCLKKETKNHIFNLNLNYNISPKITIYGGGKLMLRQFNGEINYLYTRYTDTTFDHKYGYADIGVIYRY